MRVVARRADEAGIAFAPATAVFQAIGLEADIGDTGGADLQDVGPGAMAGAAEIDGSYGIATVRIQDGAAAVGDFSRLHGRCMLCSWTVASLAGDSWRYVCGIETIGEGGRRRVASEAAARFVGDHAAAQSGCEIVGGRAAVSGGEVQALQRSVEAQAALVEGAVILIEVGLAFASQAESPGDGGGQGRGAVGDGIGNG